MPHEQHTHAKLAAIIGDPHAEEAKWMAACVAMGEKSLVKSDNAVHANVLLPMGRGLARRLIAFNAIFSWGVILMLAQQFSLLIGGPGSLWVGDHAGPGPGLGMLVSFFGALGFWRAFTGVTNKRFMIALWIGLASSAMAIGFYRERPAQMLLAVTVSAAAFWGMARLADFTRKALPAGFRNDRTTLMCGLASAPCALFVILALILSLTNPDVPAAEIVAASPAYLIMIGLTSMVSITVPAYVCTRVSRSSMVAPSLALNALYSAPLFAGLILATLVSTFTVDFGNFSASALYIVSLWAACLAPFAFVAGGSYLGAKRNAGVQRRRLESAGGLLIGQDI